MTRQGKCPWIHGGIEKAHSVGAEMSRISILPILDDSSFSSMEMLKGLNRAPCGHIFYFVLYYEYELVV